MTELSAPHFKQPLLKTPYYLSPGWLQLDPTFASLSGNPRYDRLVGRP